MKYRLGKYHDSSDRNGSGESATSTTSLEDSSHFKACLTTLIACLVTLLAYLTIFLFGVYSSQIFVHLLGFHS